jgi:hypothetical protein
MPRAALAPVLVLALVLGVAAAGEAQHLIELRGADTKYRYVDWNYTFANGVVADLFYVGVPGSNELNIGGGYAIKRGAVIVTPLVYAVVGKEGDQRGVKVAVLILVDKSGWKLASFLGNFISVSGDVLPYQVLDTLDVTRVIGKQWELGVQAGFFKAGDAWNPQVGPLVKRNDRLGAWAASYRFGPQPEFRLGRTFAF